jgi:hypothetical protein
MKKLVLILTILLFLFHNNYAGERVIGAKISLFQSVNNEIWAMTHTNEIGEFDFCQIPPGNYILTINVPLSSFTERERET